MNIGVIFAGGTGTRMRSRELPKQFLEISGKPIIVHTIEHFQQCPDIDAVIVVCVAGYLDYFDALKENYHLDKVRRVVKGGDTGQLSIYNGLRAAADIARGEKSIVLIHDGVRPLINSALLTENVRCVREHGSCITCGIVKETIVEISADGSVDHIPERAVSRMAKAPQSFWLDDILAAHNKALAIGRKDFIDSCSLMHYFGFAMYSLDGSYENIKITTPEDFYTMRAILQVKEDRQLYGMD